MDDSKTRLCVELSYDLMDYVLIGAYDHVRSLFSYHEAYTARIFARARGQKVFVKEIPNGSFCFFVEDELISYLRKAGVIAILHEHGLLPEGYVT